jgi:cobalt-precorrin-5B (C1)-methyltransferase
MSDKKTKNTRLRTGFSTGACVAACVKASFIKMQFPDFNDLKIEVLFPDNKKRVMHLRSVYNNRNVYCASVIKDAGSDPDITNGIVIECVLENLCSQNEIDSRDYNISINNSVLIIRGEEGVGTITRDGVAPPKGKWAINPIPIYMIINNLSSIGFGKLSFTHGKTFILKIRLKNGEKLAKKTLNPLLGIVGGLSVLGTTGIVVPHSHDAYIETIRILINALDRDNYKHIILTTGAQSCKAAKKLYSELSEEAFVRIADFIADSLRIISGKKIKKVTVACMPGKLFKYVCFWDNTNAKYSELDTNQILTVGHNENFEFTEAEKIIIQNAVTIREVIFSFSEERRLKLLNLWRILALKFFKQVLNNENIEVELLVFDYNGNCM